MIKLADDILQIGQASHLLANRAINLFHGVLCAKLGNSIGITQRVDLHLHGIDLDLLSGKLLAGVQENSTFVLI